MNTQETVQEVKKRVDEKKQSGEFHNPIEALHYAEGWFCGRKVPDEVIFHIAELWG